MDFMTAGTLRDYTKTSALRTRWNLKQRSGDVNAHTESLNAMLAKTPAASAAQLEIDRQQENPGDKLKKIMDKISAGKRLNQSEKAYLKEKDPKTYAQIESAEQEQKTYERELKRCRTKEEAQRVKMAHIGAALSRIRDVSNNSAIPEDKKREILSAEKYRCERLNESGRTFVKRGEYAKLPTEAEKSRAEREEREAEAVRRVETSEAAEKSGAGKESKAAEKSETRRKSERESNEAARKLSAQRADSAPESDLVRKVRRAKRRAGAAAYAASMNEDANPEPLISAKA